MKSGRSGWFLLLGWAAVLAAFPAPARARPPRYSVSTNVDYNARVTLLDSFHTNFYRVAHGVVETADGWFVTEGVERRPTPPSRFRLGVFGKFRLNAQDIARMEPVVDFDTDMELPNANNRLRLFVTTTDPASLPGADIVDRDNSLRVGARRRWLKSFNLSSGLRIRQTPQAFVNAYWTTPFSVDRWRFYPQQKLFAQSDDGVGEITSLVADHWHNRWNFRQSFSMKWSDKDERGDSDASRDIDSVQFGQDGEGWRWEAVTLFSHVSELLDEPDPTRLVNGKDRADSMGIKLSVVGDAEETRRYQVSLARKAPLRRQWLFLLISPEVSWSDDDRWQPTYALKFGLEAIFWGTPDR